MKVRYIGAQSAKRPGAGHPPALRGETISVADDLGDALVESGEWEKTTSKSAAPAADEPEEG